MINLLRSIAPLGAVEARRLYLRLRSLGLSKSEAFSTAMRLRTKERLKTLNLDLLLEGTLKHIECVVDVGANRGNWTADLLRLCSPKRTIIVEPDPSLIPILQTRFQRLPSVHLEPVALGNKNGFSELRLMADSKMNSLLVPRTEVAEHYGDSISVKGVVGVPVKRLDSITSQEARIDILKIDVQGFEHMVLEGATAALTKTQQLLLEVNFVAHYEGGLLFAEMDRRMNKHGFQLARLSNPYPPYNSGLRTFWADALYINSARKVT